MTPSDKTIAAVLALPLEARRLLAERAEGPGWFIERLDDGKAFRQVWPWMQTHVRMDADRAWLPCAPSEVLRVWAEHADGPCWQADNSEVLMSWDPYNLLAQSMCEPHDGTLDGMLRAAVQCWPGDR